MSLVGCRSGALELMHHLKCLGGSRQCEGRQAGDLFSGRAATNATKQAGQGPVLSALARLLRHNVYGISRLLAPSCKQKTSHIGKFVGSHA